MSLCSTLFTARSRHWTASDKTTRREEVVRAFIDDENVGASGVSPMFQATQSLLYVPNRLVPVG